MCDLCENESNCEHPVSFHTHPTKPTPQEIKQYIGLGGYLDDLDAEEATDDFWENCARLCHDCMNKYVDWIDWFG